MAHYLRSKGVGNEVLVGICVERSLEMIVAILSILKAGGAYVPLDPGYPEDRISFMLDDSEAAVLLTTEKLIDVLREYKGEVVLIDRDAEMIEQHPDTDPNSSSGPDNLAYVIYTSGSTGRPKGVAIEHRSAVALLSWAGSVFDAEQLSGVLASTSICFDLSIFEIFTPLSFGGTVVLAENVLQLPAMPAANEVTVINTVPSAITELLRIDGVPASVTTINLAGEPLKASLVRQIYELGTVEKVYDLYGPTEDTTYSTYTLRDSGKATIGRPISNTQAYILDRYLQPVPVGIPGELYLAGDGLARGYLNRPELTDERFIGNPFCSDRASRMYKTGDWARYLADGRIEYLGRRDNQVKIRGFRIELGEIEARMTSHPDVREVVVIAGDDKAGDKQLAAYFTANGSSRIEVNELRTYIERKLPGYMMPSAFVQLTQLPLTPNGKIDKEALLLPDNSELEEQKKEFVAARSTSEELVAQIWSEVLGLQRVGIFDNFFDLGGHSLKATQLMSRIRSSFQIELPLSILFEAGTVAELAAVLEERLVSELHQVPEGQTRPSK
jgi:amino acid adenylation domain-containing protein